MCEKCADAFAAIAREVYIKSEGVAVIVSVEEIQDQTTVGLHHKDNMTHDQAKMLIGYVAEAVSEGQVIDQDARVH